MGQTITNTGYYEIQRDTAPEFKNNDGFYVYDVREMEHQRDYDNAVLIAGPFKRLHLAEKWVRKNFKE